MPRKFRRMPTGRPEYVPDEKDRRPVEAMAAGGIDQLQISAVLDIAPKTLRKHFRHELDNGFYTVASRVIKTHIERCEAGDMRAIEWWERSRLGWTEKAPDGQAN